MMGAFVYILCAITSVVCAALLFRHTRKPGGGLLFWSGWAFVSLAAANILLFVDLVVVQDVDLSIFRNLVTLLGISMLVYGMITESTE